MTASEVDVKYQKEHAENAGMGFMIPAIVHIVQTARKVASSGSCLVLRDLSGRALLPILNRIAQLRACTARIPYPNLDD
jgi:hypothetical protein